MLAKKRVTDERIKSELRKEDMLMEKADFETAIDNPVSRNHCTKKMKFSIKGFFSRCDQIDRKKSLMEIFIFCAANNSEHRENDSNKMYLISPHQDDTILVPQTQKSHGENSANENTVQLSNETSKLDEKSQAFPETINLQSNYEEERRIRDVFKEESFKDVQPSFENKLMKMGEAIILNCRYHIIPYNL